MTKTSKDPTILRAVHVLTYDAYLGLERAVTICALILRAKRKTKRAKKEINELNAAKEWLHRLNDQIKSHTTPRE